MRAYSQDLRDRVLQAWERGDRPTEIARRLEVSRMWVYQVWHRYKQEGVRQSFRQGGYRVSRIAHLEETVRGWIAEKEDLTLAEIRGRLSGLGIAIREPAIWTQLDKWGLSHKRTRRASGRSCENTG